MSIVTVKVDKCEHDNIWYNYLIGVELLVHDDMCNNGDYCLVSNMHITLDKEDCTVVNQYLGEGKWKNPLESI